MSGNLAKKMSKFLKRLVAWMQRKMYEDDISEQESKEMLREIEKFEEESKVK